MATSERGCCVPRCGKTREDDTVLHSFPNPEKEKELYLAWTRAVGLDTSLDPYYVYRNRRVCHAHFELKFLTWTRRLSPGAIPTLLLPDSEMARVPLIEITNRPEEVSLDSEFPSTFRESHPEPNFCDASEGVQTEDIDMPILSLDQGLHAEQSLGGGEGSAKHTPSQNNFPFALDLSDAVTGVKNDPDCCAPNAGKPSAAQQVPGKSSMAMKMTGSRTKTFLLYHKEAERQIRNLQQDNIRLRRKCKSYKSRLQDAIKLPDRKVIIIVL